MTRPAINVSLRISFRFRNNVIIWERAVFTLKVVVKFMVRFRVTFRVMSMSSTRKCGYSVAIYSRFKFI